MTHNLHCSYHLSDIWAKASKCMAFTHTCRASQAGPGSTQAGSPEGGTLPLEGGIMPGGGPRGL